MRIRLSTLLLASLILALTGCTTHYVDSDSVSQYESITSQELAVPFQPVYQEAFTRDLALQSESRGLPEVSIHRNSITSTSYGLADAKPAFAHNIFSLLTLGIIPAISYYDEDAVTLTYRWNGKKIATTRKTFVIKRATSLLVPMPYVLPYSSDSVPGAIQKASVATIPGHRAELENLLRSERNHIRANVDLDDPESVSAYLGSRKANPLTPSLTHRLASLAPEDNPRLHHRKYLAKNYSYYQFVLPDEDLAWLLGPEGLTGHDIKQSLDSGHRSIQDVIDAMADQWMENQNAGYRKLTNKQRETLLVGGLPPAIVERMDGNDPDYARAEARKAEEAKAKAERLAKRKAAREKRHQLAEQRKADARAQLERLAIMNNSGQYMSPYTSDGVTAEWVNQAINANIGATAGSAAGAAAGAYAANKALESVPFGSLLGGMVGSAVGESVGRETAIEASGGWDHIRNTSDMSFRSLSDMARYLKTIYGNEADFPDVMSAASQVYPELADIL